MKLNGHSQQLYNYIHSLPVEISKLYPHQFHLGPNSKTLVLDICKKMSDSFLSYDPTLLQSISYPDFTKSDLMDAIPTPIRSHLLKIKKTTQAYSFVLGERTIRINMMFTDDFSRTHTQSMEEYIQKSLKLIYIWFSIATQYSSSDCGKEINVFLYFTDLYKRKPNKNGEPISPIYANTAYTRSCSPSSTIQIFREEEWFKVLIHESFHNLGLDFSTMNVEKCQKMLEARFSIPTEGLLFETYCETWATIINILFISFCSEVSRTEDELFSHVLTKFQQTMVKESKFAMFQSAKVLQHMNLTYTDLVEKTSMSASHRSQYKEETNVLCYYVIKSLMLFHLNIFLEWCFVENQGSLNFKKTAENLENFCSLIEQVYKDPKYMKTHEQITKHIHAHSDEFVQTTLRMTLFG